MKVLIQRIKQARVRVGGETVSESRRGLLLFLGVGSEDGEADCEKLSQKVSNLRIFEDEAGKMNLDVKQVSGEILSVPQFTLYADMRKGNRPSFDLSADPQKAKLLWERLNALLRAKGIPVQEGVFGAHMEVTLTNDGPASFLLDSKS
ncbi:MAG: D-aminoacyl-tRNA deacylase [Candidatus Omnitrophota bacterium]